MYSFGSRFKPMLGRSLDKIICSIRYEGVNKNILRIVIRKTDEQKWSIYKKEPGSTLSCYVATESYGENLA